MKAARSYLFVPASRPERIAKALASGADAVVVDLEDAVPPEAKATARAQLQAWLEGPQAAPVVLRINGCDTQEFGDDLALCRHPQVAAVMLPKAERPEDIARVADTGRPVLALVETAAAIDALRAIASAPGVQRLVFGSIDFQLDLGIDGEGEELLFFRSQIVLASRLARLQPPVDGVSTALDDEALLRADSERARRLGFGAKLCIHPRQVAAVNAAFTPDAQAVQWAQRVLQAAADAGGAAVALDGRMIDKPVILRAQDILARAGQQTPTPPKETNP
ncbi:CoA ester lyase [Aquincola tertiaricarbonis]|uniref:CoA ester lyase n=1 Tax=Aquincola tertiaricarbonis TaxID=391953 RepID=A0ABY4SG06_AQUTE|nr:CoA ester lyase [Aquincola tertiaricarbonis]URI09936.1 CoA ester lyase [Aquincola tertiaricarbonis]